MGIHYEKSKLYWNYFLAIEKDFESISRYIEFAEANNATFSIELARIIMSASQEIDVIMKQLCRMISPDSNARNINDYSTIIKAELPEMIEEKVYIPRYGMHSVPWLNWSSENVINPYWWTANNHIKHQRNDSFAEANLKNAFNSIGALLIVNLYYYKKEMENEKGESISWKEITGELGFINNFLKLKDEYYYDMIVT